MRSGGKTIEINVEESGFTSRVNCFIKGPAGVILPLIVEKVMELGLE